MNIKNKNRGPQWLRDDILTELKDLPLYAGDRWHLERSLLHNSRTEARANMRKYKEAWQQAEASEPDPVKKENIGRHTANLLLLSLIRPGP